MVGFYACIVMVPCFWLLSLFFALGKKRAANWLSGFHGLSKEECPHEYTYPVYDKEGEFLREAKGTCGGHFEGKSEEYVRQAIEEGRLW